MPNPYQAKRPMIVSLPEGRLRRLGASDEFLARLNERFTALLPAEKNEMAVELAELNDDELREGIAMMSNDDTRVPTEDERALLEDPVPKGTIGEVLRWVGDDESRRARAIAAERAGRNRTSLLYELEKRG